jgi:ATP-dependent DNA helicase RecG
VIDSPGGFPSGITTDNILEKQSPRNHLIANIFALCGLVERAGQGMNLIYETCIKNAKALPDFKGTDPYFVSITLNGLITDEKLLLLFKRIDIELLNTFTTEDYLVINSLFHTQRIQAQLRPNAKRLSDIGILEHMGRGKYLIAQQLYSSIGEVANQLHLSGKDRTAIANLTLQHIESSKGLGMSLSDIQLAFPNCTRSQLQKMIYELRDKGQVRTEGKANKARWYVV